MAMFNKKVMIEMYISDNDVFGLEWTNRILKPIIDKMDNEGADYIESISTGELIEYDELKVALRVIASLLDEKTGKDWRFV